ncbi:hypothetical protein A4R26_23840 [Niastella populi]|uniref:Uncharacterized protein n=1 Tax=Niastella populi TaxID=550983 RepID=A0A1V9FH15_9BACT|nr:hypothetical protein A4R26_23840 [Niastella populi]
MRPFFIVGVKKNLVHAAELLHGIGGNIPVRLEWHVKNITLVLIFDACLTIDFGYWRTEYYYRTWHNKLIKSTVNGLLVLIYCKSIFLNYLFIY